MTDTTQDRKDTNRRYGEMFHRGKNRATVWIMNWYIGERKCEHWAAADDDGFIIGGGDTLEELTATMDKFWEEQHREIYGIEAVNSEL